LAKEYYVYIGLILLGKSIISLIVVVRKMRLLTIFFVAIIVFQIDVFADLSTNSCALLRTTNSLTTIIPEIAKLALRYYRASSSFSAQHSRPKRFLFDEKISKDGSSGNIKGSVVEQMIANTIRDVNFTNIAILILNNNETLNKIRINIDTDAMIRTIIREIDYEKLLGGFLLAAEKEFDLEHFVESLINKTHIGIIHDEILVNGTLPEWLLKNIHPELNVQMVQQIFLTLKNVTEKFVKRLSKSERFDNYLFNMITQQALTPLNNIIQEVKEKKPKTFEKLIDIIVNNVNRVATVSEINFFERILPFIFCYIRNNLQQVQKKHQRKNLERNHHRQMLPE
jgi:hypothetical protein